MIQQRMRRLQTGRGLLERFREVYRSVRVGFAVPIDHGQSNLSTGAPFTGRVRRYLTTRRTGASVHIGEVADQVGLSLRTVRYYEEVGLIEPVERSPGGFRIYDHQAVERLTIIRDLKPLGFSLDDIRAIVELVTAANPQPDPEAITGYVERARDEHRHALRSLGAAERIIETLERISDGNGSSSA